MKKENRYFAFDLSFAATAASVLIKKSPPGIELTNIIWALHDICSYISPLCCLDERQNPKTMNGSG